MDISVTQWIIIGVGVIIAFPPIVSWVGGLSKKAPETPDTTPETNESHILTDLVSKWECLADACHEAGLHDACQKLNEVFPLLISSRKEQMGARNE